MKKIFPMIILTLIVLGYLALLRIPYHFYQEALNKGISSRFLSVNKLATKFYLGMDYRFFRMSGVTSDEKSQWENLHFNDFIAPFPIKHPSFLIQPLIYKENGLYRFGYKVLNYEKEEINRVIFHPKVPFRLELHNHLIFSLPIFERRILQEGQSAVWRDFFKKNLFSAPYLKTPTWNELYNPYDIPLSEMVYDLFILTLREKYLPKKIKNIQYWKEKNLGITEVVDDETLKGKPSRFLQEMIYFPVGEYFYPIEIRTLNEDFPAEKYRQRFLETLKYKESDPDSSIPIYAEFQRLDYEDKFTPSGLTYIFAAFSHNKDSKSFLRQAIQTMERGKNDKIFLDPFYEYGVEIYGSNFSKIIERRVESQEERLIRLKAEEEKKFREKIESEELREGPDRFESKEEKIKFYLQKAKDEGVKPQEGKNKLILD